MSVHQSFIHEELVLSEIIVEAEPGVAPMPAVTCHSLDSDELSLATARFRAFASKMPAFYLSLAVSKLVTCYAFYGLAPTWLCLGLGTFSTLFIVARALWWIRHRNDPLSAELATRLLNSATRRLIIFTALFVSFDLVLYYYGDGNARMVLIFSFMSSSMVGFFCLMHLRAPAVILACTVSVPLLILLIFQNSTSGLLISLNVLVVTAAMIIIMQSYFHDFNNLVESRAAVVSQRAETERLSEQNLRLANLDMLTELPNRRCFFSDLDQKHRQAWADGHGLAVGILDLDGFKPINDLHGHGIGDRMLRSVADRLRLLVNARTTVYRLGGDEFAFIVEAPEHDSDLVVLGNQSMEVVCQPIMLGDLVASVGCSIGFATWSDSTEMSGLLYDHADYALYHAKRTGRSRIVMFAQEHVQLITAQSAVERALRGADLANELYLVFQPIVGSPSGHTTAFEALARWKSPVLGEVQPGTFIVVAEKAGMMTSLTSILLRKALADAMAWPTSIRLSFNLSAHDIASADHVQALILMIKTSGFDPHRIDMELTETALASNFELAIAHMSMLKDLGIRISLDDFGTGYSSISHIHALPIDKVKIDRSFVKDLGHDANSYKIVKSLTALCRDMDLDCTVEGVETEEQIILLTSLGCELMQGYYFARPMPSGSIDTYLRRESDELQYHRREVAA